MASSKDYLKTLGRAKEELSDLPSTPVGKVLQSFIDNQIIEMKEHLASRRSTGSLAQSLTFQVGNDENGMTVDFLANEYWDYINSGVNGLSRQYGSAYSFRSAFPSSKMVDAFTGTGSLRGWMATKNITSLRYINAGGEEVNKRLSTEADYRSAAYVFARAVKQKGIMPTPFVDEVFNDDAIDQLQEDIFKAFESML